MENIPQKIKVNIDKISQLKKKIINWNNIDTKDLFKIIGEFEKTPRYEVSKFYNDLFNDSSFANILIEIYNKYGDDSKLATNIISAIGNMMQRYQLPETDVIYNLMLENAERKNVGPYVAIFLPKMKLFENYNNKWKYILSIKNLAPKKIAESSFESLLELYKNGIPDNYKNEILMYLKEKVDSSNNDYGKQYYLDFIQSIKW